MLGDVDEVARVPGAALVSSRYDFALKHADESRFVVAAPFVTTSSGTGLVHMAPAHGQEDYDIWLAGGLPQATELMSPIDDLARFAFDPERVGATDAIREQLRTTLLGQDVLGKGTALMVQLLADHGALLSERPLTHSYPIDWRSKQPILTRATSQWFADLTEIADDARAALQRVRYVPETARNRLSSLVQRRSEWCISRQRAWGVPLPIVYDDETGDALLTQRNVEHIIGVFEQHGTPDCWWMLPAEAFVAPVYRAAGKRWATRKDTLDVWFDSGSSWRALARVLGKRPHTEPIADVYLEGTDQHRGWFQSSLLTRMSSSGTGAAAPYSTLVTHGFVVDRNGRKMSKSIGNVVTPAAVMHGSAGDDKDSAYPPVGTDVLRWWAAKADYTRDIPISPLIMKHASDEVRKIRNTARFMLANIDGTSERITPRDAGLVRCRGARSLPQLDRYIMHELFHLERACRRAYADFDFTQGA